MKNLLAALFVCLATAATSIAQGLPAYVERVGERVTVFESDEHNYRLELADEAYTFIDFTEQVPDASFAAIRFQPNAFSLVITENLGIGSGPEQYAELVQITMSERLGTREDAEYERFEDLGFVEERGMRFFRKAVYAKVSNMPVTYIVSTTVDGERAYQLLTFASSQEDDVVIGEADKILASFSIVDSAANRGLVKHAKDVRDYSSNVFAYRFRASDGAWFDWTDLKDTNDAADAGALSARGLGAVVMPVCWQGERPTDNAIYRVMMQQLGEDYPSDFITEEHDVSKDGASGKLLIGTEESDGDEYLYHQWIVANDRCAYTLAAWGMTSIENVANDLDRLWSDFRVLDVASATDGQYDNIEQKTVNAYHLNALGLHYYDARSYRDAYRFFSTAADLVPTDENYATNAMRSLVDIDAYHEARDWLQVRIENFPGNQVILSWDAWLAYHTDDPPKALRIYREIFADGYREDDDFSAFLTLLANDEGWDEVDAVFERYTAGGVNDSNRLLQVQLRSQRGRYDEALLLLDEMTERRPFDADLTYERMAILDDMGNFAEVLVLADLLIEKGYRSLQSLYYKGDAEYQLRSYRRARESFEEALTFSPGNSNVRDYIDAIDLMLGQGDVSSISAPINAVSMPGNMQSVFAANDASMQEAGYGALYLSRITGYEFAGGETRTQTMYRKIRVFDDNGVSQYSTLEFDFDPSYEQLYVNTLRVRDTAGEVVAQGDLATYYITNSEDGYEASTQKTVHLPVPSLAPGVVIEVVVSKLTGVDAGTFPLETEYLASDRPIGYSALFVAGMTDEIRFESNAVPAPRESGDALVWELLEPVAYRWEPLQPYFDQILPWVQLGTVSDDWETVGAEYLAEIDDKLDSSRVAQRADRLVEGVDSLLRRIELLSAYVQDEIHYEAIEFGRRAYIPKTASETMRDRYGDCKDHAVLLYTMMESVGIDASLALVNLQQEIVPALPNTDQFDHVVVSVQTDGGRVFIDTTDKDMRLGQLAPRSMAGNHALVLGEKPELIRIPDYDSRLTGLDIERVVEPGVDGSINVTETARLTGYQAAGLRGQLRSIETSEMRASLQRWVADRYGDAELTNHFVENVFDASYDLIVEIEYTLPLESDGAFDVPGFLEAYYLEYDRVPDRRFPFQFFYPLRVNATTSVKLPTGHRLETVGKKPGEGESRFGNWRREVVREDGGLKIEFDYVASETRFGPEDYREFSEFQREAVDAIELPLILQ